MSTRDWKWPPTAGPYENDGCFAVSSPTKGPLLVAVRDNPNTSPVERDSNVAFAHIAMQFHDPLVGLVETLCQGIAWNIENNPTVMNQADAEALAEARALLDEIAAASMRRNT